MRQVIKQSRTDMDFSGNKGLTSPSGGACPKNHLVPDVTFGPIELLLVDRDTAQVALFSEPKQDDYREHCARPFGKPITLPEPFAFELDTTDLL